MTPVVELDRLSVRFRGRPILNDLTRTISGQSIGLLGPNGAGKTTLLHTLLGFHPPSGGTARIFGKDIRRERTAIRAMLGYMPENDSFIAGMTAVRFIRMFAELSGIPSAEALERTHEALYFVGLGEARYRVLESYSLGMKQLAKLAQSLVVGPKLLFLDEPTNGLDPPARKRMIGLIKELRDSGKVKILVSSHLLRDVEECCDQALILKDGVIADYCDLEKERRTNRDFVELELKGDTESFIAAVTKLGCEAPTGRRGITKLILSDQVVVRDLFQLANAHGASIHRLNYKRDSLEEIFQKAMELPNGSL